MTSDEIKGSLDPVVRTLCENKHNQLHDKKKDIERRIAKYFPQDIKRAANGDPSTHTVSTYSRDTTCWMALVAFREWYETEISFDKNRHAPDGGCEFYHKLGRGGHQYCTRADLQKSFYKLFPMTRKGMDSLENNLLNIKDDIGKIVAPLVVSPF